MRFFRYFIMLFAYFYIYTRVFLIFRKVLLDITQKIMYNIRDWAGQSRDNMPKGLIVRKVRASESRITDNVRLG